jgi:WhiB family redox-sensing transcriptional regulator
MSVQEASLVEADGSFLPGSQEQLEAIAARAAEAIHGGRADLLGTVDADDEPDLSWRSAALCRDTSPELFFPVGTTGLALELVESAKAVCRRCPAQAQCLEFALTTHQDSGVWGAASEEQRRDLRRRFLRKPARQT